MKLELNKKYKNRKGEIRTIIELFDSENNWDEKGFGYCDNGQISRRQKSPYDLIEEVSIK